MSNRCINCEKFVSLEPSEDPEWNSDPEIDEDGAVTGELRVVLNCAECGEEMKETTIELDISPSDIEGLEEHKEAALAEATARDKAKMDLLTELGAAAEEEIDDPDRLEEVMDEAEDNVRTEEACEFEIECTSVSVDEQLQTKDKHGKPITKMRYMKKFYVIDIELEIRCTTGAPRTLFRSECKPVTSMS
jgi:hypothetical protein